MKKSENELLLTAYDELEKLKNEKPSWDVYSKMSDLITTIQYLKGAFSVSEQDDISIIIDELVEAIGERATIEKIKNILFELKQDMECVSPYLARCLEKKLKS